MTEASERYRQLRARGICANCGRTPALVPRAYCEACQRRRDAARHQRERLRGVVIAPREEPTLGPMLTPEPVVSVPQPRKVVTLRPPHLGREVEFEVVFP